MAATTGRAPAHARRIRSAALLGVGSAVLAGSVLAGTGMAFAKSGAYVSANTRTARIGQSVQVTAGGGDDAARYSYVCLDERIGSAGWRQLGCAKRPWTSYSRSVRADKRSEEQFRARLLVTNRPGGPLHLDRISATVTVLIH